MTLRTLPPGYQALRRGRCSQRGQVYLITTITQYREPRFLDWPQASAASAIIADVHNWSGARLLCWVLMPDHWHGMVELQNETQLSVLMRLMKGGSARAINLASGRRGPVWMPGFHDRVLRDEDSLIDVARYIVANPLRAGLVKRIGDYPYWDCTWLSRR